jgi:hypothetical protein
MGDTALPGRHPHISIGIFPAEARALGTRIRHPPVTAFRWHESLGFYEEEINDALAAIRSLAG